MADPFHALEEAITTDVTRALQEDIRTGDLTAALVPPDRPGEARLMTRQNGVLCGTEWFTRVFEELDPDVEIFWHHKDGDDIVAGASICEIDGNARAMLTAERTAMNFVQLMSGIATKARAYAKAVEGTRAKVIDTRKTLPGLRIAQKYAVQVGGASNNRIGLFDGILLKENHLVAAGGVKPAVKAALDAAKHLDANGLMLQVEVETLDQLREALDAGAPLILLDNFDLARMREAVKITGNRAELEASGGVNLKNVREIAETGVHRISVGTLTKDVEALDLSMRFIHH